MNKFVGPKVPVIARKGGEPKLSVKFQPIAEQQLVMGTFAVRLIRKIVPGSAAPGGPLLPGIPGAPAKAESAATPKEWFGVEEEDEDEEDDELLFGGHA